MPPLLTAADPDVAATRRPLLEAAPLAGRFFVDPEIFHLEMEVLFRRRWLCVGRETDWLEAGMVDTREIGLDSVVVTRAEDGEKGEGCVHAFDTWYLDSLLAAV